MKKSDVTFRPATQRDFEAFYGRPSPYTLRAVLAEMDGRIVGFGGFYAEPSGAMVAFTDIDPALKQNRRAMVRGAHLVIGLIERAGIPVVARANPQEPTAPGALRHFGFRHVADDIYARDNP